MANTAVAGTEPWSGRTKAWIGDHTGPVSYTTGGESLTQSIYGGPNIFGLAGFYKVEGGVANSGNLNCVALTGGSGVRSTVKLLWAYTNYNGPSIATVTGTGGTGMTPGTYPLAFSGGGGTGAAGTITVTSATTYTIAITNVGSGYTSAPTVTAATGGTPPTLTATTSTVGLQVAAGTNLSSESIRLVVLGG